MLSTPSKPTSLAKFRGPWDQCKMPILVSDPWLLSSRRCLTFVAWTVNSTISDISTASSISLAYGPATPLELIYAQHLHERMECLKARVSSMPVSSWPPGETVNVFTLRGRTGYGDALLMYLRRHSRSVVALAPSQEFGRVRSCVTETRSSETRNGGRDV